MRIAGVDPGTIHTGVGIIEKNGKQTELIFFKTIHGGREKLVSKRLHIIFSELKSILEEWKPDVLALENVFYQKDFRAAIKVGEARAVAMLAASLSGIPVSEYPPARIKQAICGNGRAAKGQVQYMVRHLLRFRGPISADSADALAVALCHLSSYQFDQVKKLSYV